MAEQTLRERACRFVDCPAEKSSAAKFHDPECNELLAEFTAAVEQERERCAKVAENLYQRGQIGPDIASAIRDQP